VQPGVLLSEFQEEVEQQGLFYPPDPTETNCYLGATVATNSSGAKTFKYGPSRDYVLEASIILPDGETLSLERGKVFADGNKLNLTADSGKQISIELPDYQMPKTKHAAGYFVKENMDALDLFIGSEGTLGIFSELKLKLLPLSENILSAVMFFDQEDDALNFVAEARDLSVHSRENWNDNEINARGLEFFDFNSLQFLKRDYPNIPENVEGAVWFEQETNSENEDEILTKWVELIYKHNGDEEKAWMALDKKERQKFQDFRHAVSWKVNEYITQKNILKVGTDIAVPDNEFFELYQNSKKTVESKEIDYIAYGHFGNSHLHLNMLPKDPEEYKTAKKIYAELCEKAVKLGGTISAEHGIGKLKRNYLLKMFGEERIQQMAAIKRQLDPNKILGIGNIFDPKYL
jgi:D-lactate dehydrogenase (cytochrome)